MKAIMIILCLFCMAQLVYDSLNSIAVADALKLGGADAGAIKASTGYNPATAVFPDSTTSTNDQ